MSRFAKPDRRTITGSAGTVFTYRPDLEGNLSVRTKAGERLSFPVLDLLDLCGDMTAQGHVLRFLERHLAAVEDASPAAPSPTP